MMKKLLLLAGWYVLFCQTSCTQKPEQKEEHSNYTVTTPLQIDTSFTKEYVSQIKSVRNIEIRAQEKGYLLQIYVDEGQHVKAGQLLFKVNPKMYEAELLKAQSEEKALEIEMQNTKLLSDRNVVSKNELAVAIAKLNQAKADVSLAKLQLSFTEIRAPFNGIVDRIPKKLGSLLDEGELLTSLSDNSQMFAYFNVSEPEYLNYQTHIKDRGNTKVSLKLANNELLANKGDIETVEGEFDNETGSIAFRARFANPDQLLRNGETGKVLMTVPLKRALIIPQKSTYEIQDKIYVFVIDNKGIAHARNIAIGGTLPDLYIVSEGLSESDQILLEGVQKVKEGDKIKYTTVLAKEVISNLQLKAE
jgi:membrane fusion protein (multidrug efflux system)